MFYCSLKIFLLLIKNHFPCVIISTPLRSVAESSVTPELHFQLSFHSTLCGLEIADNLVIFHSSVIIFVTHDL